MGHFKIGSRRSTKLITAVTCQRCFITRTWTELVRRREELRRIATKLELPSGISISSVFRSKGVFLSAHLHRSLEQLTNREQSTHYCIRLLRYCYSDLWASLINRVSWLRLWSQRTQEQRNMNRPSSPRNTLWGSRTISCNLFFIINL